MASVRVDQQAAAFVVARKMNLADRRPRYRIQQFHGVAPVVDAVDVDIINVQQQPATGLRDQCREELGLGELGLAVLDVGRDILEQHSFAEFMLRTTDAVCEV